MRSYQIQGDLSGAELFGGIFGGMLKIKLDVFYLSA